MKQKPNIWWVNVGGRVTVRVRQEGGSFTNKSKWEWGWVSVREGERAGPSVFPHSVPTADLPNPCLNWGRIPAHMFPWNECGSEGRWRLGCCWHIRRATAAELMHSVPEHFIGTKTGLLSVSTSDLQTLDVFHCHFSFSSLNPAWKVASTPSKEHQGPQCSMSQIFWNIPTQITHLLKSRPWIRVIVESPPHM